jgi:hypothetical protein
MSLHTIGDSHSYFGWKNIWNHHLGPRLCYSFGKHKLNLCDIRGFNLKDGDTVIFCLGEIDCRCHIKKHITELITYQEIISKIVNDYFDAILLNVSVLNVKLKNVCVYNVPPPAEKHNTQENPECPFVGTDEERKQYTLFFNEKLREKCAESGFVFFDIYNFYTTENGFLRKDLSDGIVHIRDGTHIAHFIEKHL